MSLSNDDREESDGISTHWLRIEESLITDRVQWISNIGFVSCGLDRRVSSVRSSARYKNECLSRSTLRQLDIS